MWRASFCFKCFLLVFPKFNLPNEKEIANFLYFGYFDIFHIISQLMHIVYIFWYPTCTSSLFQKRQKRLSERFHLTSPKSLRVDRAIQRQSTCVFVWRRLWLQKPVDKFLCVVSIRYEYAKHSPRLKKYSALWVVTVRPTKHLLLKKKWLSGGFLKFKHVKLCQASE